MTGATAMTEPIAIEPTPIFDETKKELDLDPFDPEVNDDYKVASLKFDDQMIAFKELVRKAYLAV
jgi:hypothetical protein